MEGLKHNNNVLEIEEGEVILEKTENKSMKTKNKVFSFFYKLNHYHHRKNPKKILNFLIKLIMSLFLRHTNQNLANFTKKVKKTFYLNS